MKKCTECGGTSLTEFKEDYEYLRGIGIPVILLKIPKWKCEKCSEDFIQIPKWDALDKALCALFLDLPYRLWGSEFHFLRRLQSIDLDDLVERFSVEHIYTDPRSLLQYEREIKIVPWKFDLKLREWAAEEFKLVAPSKDLGKDSNAFQVKAIKACLDDGVWTLLTTSGIKSESNLGVS